VEPVRFEPHSIRDSYSTPQTWFALRALGIEPSHGARGEVIVWLIPARSATLRCGVAWGNHQTMRVRLSPLRCTSLREPDCHQPPRFCINSTLIPLNTNSQRIQFVLFLSCRVAPSGFAPTPCTLQRCGSGRYGSVAVGLASACRRACASPEFPP